MCTCYKQEKVVFLSNISDFTNPKTNTMRRSLFIFLAGAFLYGCSNSAPKTDAAADASKRNILEITNDMENASAIIPSWINEKTVIAMKSPAAHSGEYASVTNDTAEYGYAYQELFKNINTGLPKKVSVSGWVYTTVASPKLSMIANISENKQNVGWKSVPLTDNLTEAGKWVEFDANFYFDKPLSPDQEIRIFPWNQSKKPIYIDDLRISFEY
jgi:hypothetical protein